MILRRDKHLWFVPGKTLEQEQNDVFPPFMMKAGTEYYHGNESGSVTGSDGACIRVRADLASFFPLLFLWACFDKSKGPTWPNF